MATKTTTTKRRSTCCTHSTCTTYTTDPTGLCPGHRPPDPPHGELIGAFTNRWRGRRVLIYEHPSDPTRVITRGVPLSEFTFGTPATTSPHVWTDEPRTAYARYIGSYDRVYE